MKKEEYLLKRIAKNDHMHGIFFDKIDYIKREDSYIHPLEKDKDIDFSIGENVFYKFNSLGFRSDEFTDKHDGKHILFAGCSETEGSGGNLDALWAWITYNKISEKDKLSGFYNIGRAGWGWQIIISNVLEYIKSYGSPDYLFIMFPNIGRNIKWLKRDDNEFEIYYQEMLLPYLTNSNDDILKRPVTTVDFQRKILVDFILIIKLFEEYCNFNNINLYWSTWDKLDHDNYLNLNIFNNFVEMEDNMENFLINRPEYFEKIKKQRTDWIRKRDGHQGYLPHLLWANNFLTNMSFDPII